METKKALCLILALIMLFPASLAFAEGEITFSEDCLALYHHGGEIIVKGETSIPYINILLQLPEEKGAANRYFETISASQFAQGVTISIGTDLSLWPEGTYTLSAASGNSSASIAFDIYEEEEGGGEDDTEPTTATDATQATSGGHSTDGTSLFVKADKNDITLAVGESESVTVTVNPPTSKSVSWITDDTDIVSLSPSSSAAKITAKKTGKATIWAYVGDFYAQINVTVKRASVTPTEGSEATEPTQATQATQPTEPTEATEGPEESEALEFSDMDDAAWAINAVTFLANRGIVTGYEGKFNPNAAVTRAEFAAMLVRAVNVEERAKAQAFSDVTEDDWFYDVVTKAQRANIITGYEGKFNPGANVMRQDAALMAQRAAKIADASVVVPFDDDIEIAPYAKSAVYAMREKGIINGVSETVFSPRTTTTRAQAAKIIYELIR